MAIFSAPKPVLHPGIYAHGFLLLLGWVRLTPAQLATHKHIMGVSGMGKSKLLESIYLELIRQGIAVTLVDPHSDSAEAILTLLISMGFFNRLGAYKRLLYVEFSDEERFKAIYGARLMKAKSDIDLAHQVNSVAPLASRVVPIGS